MHTDLYKSAPKNVGKGIYFMSEGRGDKHLYIHPSVDLG